MPQILLVDDDEAFADMLAKTLVRSGYAVLRARDGNEALQIFDPQTVSLVVTELVMPVMDGIELIRKLRKLHPGTNIVAMADDRLGNRDILLRVARHMGANYCLTKPFTAGQLLTAIATCLNQAR